MTLGTFGLPPSGRTLGRYPFHHTERTLEVYMSLCHKHSTLPRMSLSSVACEGSHVRNFGRLVVESTLYPPPFQGVVPTQHSSTLGLGPYCGLTVHYWGGPFQRPQFCVQFQLPFLELFIGNFWKQSNKKHHPKQL